MKTWKEYWKWWLQKFFSLPISVSIYAIAILTWLVVKKIISDTAFMSCFIAVIVQRAGKDIFDRVNNKNNGAKNNDKENNQTN